MRDTHKTAKIRIISFIVVTVVTLGGAGIWLATHKGDANQHVISTSSNSTAQTTTSADAVSYKAVAGKTVLEQLKQHTKNVETKDSQYGVYVDAINGKKGGTDNKYWVFYVDGKMADKGAGEYTTTGGEKIEWKFE